jgi:hypothetical protein
LTGFEGILRRYCSHILSITIITTTTIEINNNNNNNNNNHHHHHHHRRRRRTTTINLRLYKENFQPFATVDSVKYGYDKKTKLRGL